MFVKFCFTHTCQFPEYTDQKQNENILVAISLHNKIRSDNTLNVS